MSNNIFEELPSRKGGEAQFGADAAAGIEKRARQLVYDARYEVKKMLAGKKADPASQERMVLQRIAKSTAIPAVKTRARQMVSKKAAVAEDFIPGIEDAAVNNVAKAMFKVFVEGVDQVIPDYLEELHGLDDKKYKIRVTDPKTGNSYVRYGTREKITQLRSKGLKVEMTEYGEPREGERKRGEETARATGGGGKAKKDYDGDGKIESGAKEYRGVVHNAIQRRKGLNPDGKDTSSVKEEFLADGTESTEGQNKGKITGKNVDNYSSGVVKVSPEDGTQSVAGPKNVYAHTELEGQVLSEKSVSRAQQAFMALVYKAKKGEKPASPEVAKAAKGMTKKEARKFAKTKHKGLPEKVKEEKECDTSEKEKDTRGDYAKINLIKNKLRAMGAKNPIVMMNSEETVEEGRALGKAGSESDDNPKGAAVRASSGRGMTMTPARGLGASKPEGSDEERRKKHADQVRSDRRAAARERSEAGEDRLGRLIRSVQKDNYQPDGDQLDELNRLEKEQGKESGGSSDEAYRSVKRTIRGMEGKPEGQRKKVPGKKPPVAGEYGGPRSPAQKVAARRASAQRAQDMYKPRAGESD